MQVAVEAAVAVAVIVMTTVGHMNSEHIPEAIPKVEVEVESYLPHC